MQEKSKLKVILAERKFKATSGYVRPCLQKKSVQSDEGNFVRASYIMTLDYFEEIIKNCFPVLQK